MPGQWPKADEIRNLIAKHGQIIVSPVTDSMYPLIREQRDTVVLAKPAFPLKKYDVALFERGDGLLVLHRVIKADKDGCVFSGDHYAASERGITDDQVCAVMTGFFHKEKYTSVDSPSYKLYCFFWCGSFLPRRVLSRLWRVVKKLTGAKRAPF